MPEKLPPKHGVSRLFLVVYAGYTPALRKPHRFTGAPFFVGEGGVFIFEPADKF